MERFIYVTTCPILVIILRQKCQMVVPVPSDVWWCWRNTFKAVWRTWGPWGSFKSVAFRLREVILYIFDLYLYIWNVIHPTYLTKPMRKRKKMKENTLVIQDVSYRCEQTLLLASTKSVFIQKLICLFLKKKVAL